MNRQCLPILHCTITAQRAAEETEVLCIKQQLRKQHQCVFHNLPDTGNLSKNQLIDNNAELLQKAHQNFLIKISASTNITEETKRCANLTESKNSEKH